MVSLGYEGRGAEDRGRGKKGECGVIGFEDRGEAGIGYRVAVFIDT
jgi:hypothetical protein